MKIVTIVIVKVMPMRMMIMMAALIDNQICQELWVFGGKDRHWEATDHIQVLYSLHHHNCHYCQRSLIIQDYPQIFTLTQGWRVIEGGLGRPMAKVNRNGKL